MAERRQVLLSRRSSLIGRGQELVQAGFYKAKLKNGFVFKSVPSPPEALVRLLRAVNHKRSQSRLLIAIFV